MSEDESPTRGQPIHQQQHEHRQSSNSNAENDANNSIIEKVKSRVSSIFPQTISKWFSPSTNDSNGGIRRRREEDEDEEGNIDNEKNDDDSDGDDEVDENNDRSPVLTAPPAKRSRLNMHEGSSSFKESQSFRASTPLTVARNSKRLAVDTTGEYSQPVSSRKYRHHTNAVDCIESRHQIDTTNSISSRRSLNIPSVSGDSATNLLFDNIRRARHRKAPTVSSSSYITSPLVAAIPVEENEDEDSVEELNINDPNSCTVLVGRPGINLKSATIDDELEEDDVISEEIINVTNSRKNKYINGNYSHGNIDSTSESGDSRSSSVQKHRVKSGLFNTCNRSNRTIGNGLNFFSHLDSRKSLFSDKHISNMLNNSTLSLTSLNRRQFNSSLYGSTSALSDSRLLNTFSPFYKGQTTFGGAGAYSKYALNPQNSMRITPTLIRPMSSLSSLNSSTNSLNQVGNNQSMAISSTAKRILDLINDFPTPLNDAKKMANNIKSPALVANRKRFNDADLASSRAMRLSTVRTPYSRPSTYNESLNNTKQLAPSIRELQVPSMSQLLQMKKLQNSTERARKVGNASDSILNCEKEYKLPTEDISKSSSSNHISKIKNKVKSSRVSTKTNINNEKMMPDINLPEIPLPFMKSVPKIDIVLTAPSSNIVKSSVSTSPSSTVPTKTFAFSSNSKTNFNQLNSITTAVSKSDLNNKDTNKQTCFADKNSQFKFSMPIEVATDAHDVELKNIDGAFKKDSFKFSSPIHISKKMNADENMSNMKDTFLEQTNKNKTMMSSMDTTTTQSLPKLKTGSVLEALKKQSTVVPNETTSLSTLFKKSSTKWECEVCMIQNDIECDACVACTTPRKKKETANTSSLPSIKSTFGDAFKPKNDTWECSVCMIRNKLDTSKCVACTTPKPGGTSVELPPAKPLESVPNLLDSGFKNIVTQQSSKWECPACMTRNESTRIKCVCCEQAKPGCNNSSSVPKFSFGSSANSTKFTFGIPATAATAVTTAPKDDLKTQTIQPETSKSTGFTFGINPTASVTSSVSSSSTVTTTTPSTGFKFGFTSNSAATSHIANTVTENILGKDKIDAAKPAISFELNKTTNETSKPVSDGLKIASSISAGFGNTGNSVSSPMVSTSVTGAAFKPIGGFSFGAKAADQTETTPKFTPSSSIFGSIQKLDNVKTTSTADQTLIPTLPVMSTSTATSSNEGNKLGFSFRGSSTSNTTIETVPKAVATAFSLDQTIASTSAPPVFGSTGNALNSNAPSLSISNTPVFGSMQSISSTSKTTSSTSVTPSLFGSSNSAATPSTSFSLPKSSATPSSDFGSFSLPKTQTSTNQSSNLNVFEGSLGISQKVAKPESGPVFGSATSTTNQGFSFNTTNQPAKAQFTFGSGSTIKPSEKPATSMFGVPTASENNVSSLPTFGTFAANANNSQQQNTSTFGQTFGASAVTPAASAPSFGSNNTQISSGMFSFGSAPTSTFVKTAETTSPIFGFGSGSTTSTNKSSLEIQKPNTGFNFAAPTQNVPSGGFSFGSANNNNNNNNNINKPAFNFSSNPSNVPSFNFTGISETNPNAPFQFNAASAVPSNNIFAPTPTPGAQGTSQARRKVRTGTRRLTPR